MCKIKKMLPYLLVCGLTFYITPLIFTDTGGFMSMLLIVVPITCFTASLIYGVKNKFMPFQLMFPVFIGILFVPTIIIFYNETAWVYAVAYTAISLFGNGIGYGIARLYKRTN